MSSFTDNLLPIYIVGETIRANYAYFAFQTAPHITPSLVALLSETLKLVIAVVITAYSEDGLESIQKKCNSNHAKEIMRYGLPAALYLTNNLIYFTVLPATSPSLLQLPATALLHHLWLRRQNNKNAWISLGFLSVGLILFSVPSGDNTKGWLLAPVAGLVIAIFSAIASIASESLTKSGSFWESQFWLYIWGTFFSVISYPIATRLSPSKDDSAKPNISTTATVTIAIYFACLTAGVGLIVAAMLRKKDNLMKLVGTSISLLTIATTQYFLFPSLRSSGFTIWKILGGLVVVLSTGFYNYFKDIDAKDSENGVGRFLESMKASNTSDGDAQVETGVTLVPALKRLFARISSRLRPVDPSVAYTVVEGASETYGNVEDLPSNKDGK
ncbi:CMP-sialic acid transporter 2 protein [Rutstroemia sp. NJR-2017a WRK4]|nr:CMP-sialic acid transporter 2 protein [Rutstroemia sp. NJR-2017a WRK4]